MANATFADTRMHFEARLPSGTWEAVPLFDAPQVYVWAWFKPVHAPAGVVFSIPDEMYQVPAIAQLLTIRRLVFSEGIDPASVAMWFLYGMSQDAQQGLSPLLDQPIPQPPPGVDRSVLVMIQMAFVPAHTPAPMAMPVSGSVEVMLDRIDADWTASLHLEKELESQRRQLGAVSARLNSLNRDLSTEERLGSDREDRDDWLDARRMLRDASGRRSRFTKECDVGETVYAGKKHWFEQIHAQHVVTRQGFAGIEQAVGEFEAYRKSLQVLINNTKAALNNAAQDGERRAQSVLSRIASKVATARSKR